MITSEIFKQPVRLSIPGFRKQEELVDQLNVYPPLGVSSEQWYNSFESRITSALLNRKCLPIFRSSHGEFCFTLGKLGIPRENLRKQFRFYLSRIYRTIRYQSVFYSGTPGYGYETYKQWILPKLRSEYAHYLKWISENGILCIYFADRDAFPQSLQIEYLHWLSDHGIILNRSNYGHIYFVYGFFNGPNKSWIYRDRKVLIINSSQTKERQRSIIRNLLDLGAKEIKFIPISRSASMLDNISPPLHFDPDLCLVGAGVGSAKMIFQMQDLNCPVVDVGFILDTLADPSYLKKRIYCVHDDVWDEYFGDNTPEWAKSFVNP